MCGNGQSVIYHLSEQTNKAPKLNFYSFVNCLVFSKSIFTVGTMVILQSYYLCSWYVIRLLMNQVFNYTTTYHHNDVLCGRGRCIREHVGNKQFISIVKELKSAYVAAGMSEKRMYADLVVREIRSLKPPGRS